MTHEFARVKENCLRHFLTYLCLIFKLLSIKTIVCGPPLRKSINLTSFCKRKQFRSFNVLRSILTDSLNNKKRQAAIACYEGAIQIAWKSFVCDIAFAFVSAFSVKESWVNNAIRSPRIIAMINMWYFSPVLISYWIYSTIKARCQIILINTEVYELTQTPGLIRRLDISNQWA